MTSGTEGVYAGGEEKFQGSRNMPSHTPAGDWTYLAIWAEIIQREAINATGSPSCAGAEIHSHPSHN